MHYKNGREAKDGDPVIHMDESSNKVKVGTLHSTVNTIGCNGQNTSISPGGTRNDCITIKDCVHAEDGWNAVEVSKP